MRASSKISILWLEIILIALLVSSALGIWMFVEQRVEEQFKQQEPSLESIQQEESILTHQISFDATTKELEEVHKLLFQKRLEFKKQISEVNSLESAYPEISSTPLESSKIPTKLNERYKTLIIDKSANEKLIKTLEGEVNTLQNKASKHSKDLLNAQDTASEKLENKKREFESNKTNTKVRHSLAIIVPLMSIFSILILAFKLINRKKIKIQAASILGITAALQLILISYQSYGLIGTALIGLAISILILAFLTLTKV